MRVNDGTVFAERGWFGLFLLATFRTRGWTGSVNVMRMRQRVFILIGASTVMLPVMSQGADAGGVDPWREIAGHHTSASVAAVSPTSAFYAGGFGARHLTRLKNWDGESWTNAPGMARPHSALTAIDASGPDDAWAVGHQTSRDRTQERSMLIHWDGVAWRVSHDGGLGHTAHTLLYDVSMAAPDDVWAAGFDYNDHGTDIEPILLHWDGATWTLVRVPLDALELYAVTATRTGEVWVTGYAAAQTDSVIMHWDGQTWNTTVAAGDLYSLDALSPDDVWAAGTNLNTRKTAIEHWDGETWTVVPSPSPGIYGTYLSSISAASADDVWAVGDAVRQNGEGSDTVIEHWDGHEWSIAPSPSPGSHWNSLDDVSADSATDAWASGTFSNAQNRDPAKTLLMHWDGTTWTRLHDVR